MNTAWFLKHGTVVDGSGAPARRASVLLRDGRIAAIGSIEQPADAQEIDCRGLAIAPGFLDAHSHSDLQVIEERREKLVQGVTSEVVGNCGFSAYPPSPDPADLRQFADGILCGGDRWGWPSSQAYLRAAEQSATAHVVSLVGHGSLRTAVAGNRQGPLEEPEVARMEALLEEAFDAGAAGFSTGLMYAPGSSAPASELQRLCRVVAKRGKIYTSHIRSYFADLVPAIEEQIELARRSGCRLQISHLQAVGAANWPQHQRALDTIERARAGGIDIAFDCYPYIAGSTVLTQLLPQRALDGGTKRMLERLADGAERRKIASEIKATIAWRWCDVYISAVGSPENAGTVGRNLEQIGTARGCEPVDAMIDLLLEEAGQVNMLSFNQSEENLRLSLTHPLGIVISDGFYVKGRPHPRLCGTFPFLLGEICRNRKWLTLEDAVRRITSAPAERFAVRGRGVLQPGAFADVAVFDPERVTSPATYEDPEQPPVGIEYVFREGRLLAGSRAATVPAPRAG
jgi:N-acyl-D-amino-acid deacylase